MEMRSSVSLYVSEDIHKKCETDIRNIRTKMGKKSLCISYFLWLFFGWFGVHHFYLGRDRHAFIYWSTLGGFFCFGWFRDLWRIPEYVDDANEEPEYMESLLRKLKLRKEPPFNIVRFTAEMLVGYIYGILVRLAIPEECPIVISGALVAFGVAVGVHLVGNVGREKGGFFYPLIACELCLAALTFLTGEEGSYMYCALAGTCTFNYIREYRREGKKYRGTCKRLTTLGLSASVVIVLWCSFLYFNAHVTTEDGEKVKFRDAINNFFTSPAWLEFKETFWQLYEEGRKQGWKNIYDEFVKALDPTGETNALKVLGVPEGASEEQIKKQYKKLAVKFHPDRYKGDPKEAEAKFIEIQQAYETLSKIKNKRKARNRTSRTDKDRTEF